MLAPQEYRRDLESSLLGRLINNKPEDPNSSQEKDQRSRTEKLWNRHFPREPFDLDLRSQDFQEGMVNGAKMDNHFKYDIVAACARQKVFFYQVSLPHYQDESFLTSAVQRYAMYLLLQKNHPDKFLVPCYDMDIVWHTHQAHPINYLKDTQEILGRALHHDDSVSDRAPGSKLSNSSELTMKVWKDTFGEQFRGSGSMYRGPRPQGCLLALTKTRQQKLITGRTALIRVSRVKAKLETNQTYKARLLTRLQFGKNMNLNLNVKANESFGEILSNKLATFSADYQFEKVEENKLPKISFQLKTSQKVTSCLCLPMTDLEVHSDPPTNLFPFPSSPEIRNVKNSFIEADVGFSDFGHKLRETKFEIQPGAFYDCIIPETVQVLWGPVPLERLPPGVDNTCRAVTHGIVNELGDKEMTVHLLHSLPLMLSAVQVFVGSEMAVVAHTVGADTIGGEAKLQLDTTFHGLPWRAMLVKDNLGDYAICVAAWVGIKIGVPGVKGTNRKKGIPGEPGSQGHFQMVYYNLRTGKVEGATIKPDSSWRLSMTLGSTESHWETGHIDVKVDEATTVVQSICLSFVASTLYLLVQPRPEDEDAVEQKWLKLKKES